MNKTFNKILKICLGGGIAIMFMFSFSAQVQASFSGGTGTAADPFQIRTKAEFSSIRDYGGSGENNYYLLMNDIDLGAVTEWSPIGVVDSAPFKGHFNGGGFIIDHLYIHAPSNSGIGLFGQIYYGASVVNLTLDNVDIFAENYHGIGAVAGWNDGYISKVQVSGTIVAPYSNSKNAGDYEYVGGITGTNGYMASVKNSSANMTISGNDAVGGIVGGNYGTIISSFSTGSVTFIQEAGGGVVGLMSEGGAGYTIISNVYSHSSVTTTTGDYIGGLIGYHTSGTINNSYSTGLISTGTATHKGAISIGSSGNVINSFWDSTINPAFLSPLDTNGTAKTTTELQTNSTFSNADWDMVNTWALSSGYPTLNMIISAPTMGSLDFDSQHGLTLNGLYWDVSDDGGIPVTSYSLRYSLSGMNSWTVVDNITNKYMDLTLATAGNYDIQVRAKNDAGFGEYSSSLNVSVVAPHEITINNCSDLNLIGSDSDHSYSDNYTLVHGIDCTDTFNWNYTATPYCLWGDGIDNQSECLANGDLWIPAGNRGFMPIGGNDEEYFQGVFDGAGFTIDGLTINRPDWNGVGMFQGVGEYGTVKNLHLTNINIIGRGYVGGLASYSDGIISKTSTAGSVAINGNNDYAGGLVAENDGTIEYSYSTATVNSQGEGVGGLVGYNNGQIHDSYATGSVNASESYTYEGDQYYYGSSVGGLVGDNEDTIYSSYSVGAVYGGGDVGGMVGYDDNDSDGAQRSFWDMDTSLQSDSSSGIGKTTTEMKNLATYTADLGEGSWDFGNVPIWKINPNKNNGYPYLAWQEVALFAGGDGSVGSHYQIVTCQQLENINTNVDTLSAHYILNGNIDCSGITNFVPIGINGLSTRFTGYFDGNNHKISNLTINRPTEDFIGLFGSTDGNATIRNINLENINIVGKNRVGGLVGYVNNITTVSGSSVISGSVSGGSRIGGLVGSVSYLINLTDSSNNAIVSANYTGPTSQQGVGGLIGVAGNAIISTSYNTGSVNAIGTLYTGGLIGSANNLSINKSYNTGSVTGNSTTHTVGGLAGAATGLAQMAPMILDSYNTGNVSGAQRVGGLIGFTPYVSVLNSYNSGNVTATYASGATDIGGDGAGGLVGINSMDGLSGPFAGTGNALYIENSFNVGAITASKNKGGLLGFADTIEPGVVSGGNFDGWSRDAKTISLLNNFYYKPTGSTLNWNDQVIGIDTTGKDSLNYFKNTSNVAPFIGGENSWDFTTIWQKNLTNYPTLRFHSIGEPINIGPTPEKFQSDIEDGFIVVEGSNPTSTPKITFDSDYTIVTGEAKVVLPAGTEMTKVGGGALDFTTMNFENITDAIKGATVSNIAGAVSIGIPNLSLSFSKNITVTIPVGATYNGQTLSVYFQNTGSTDWNSGLSCLVADSLCVFQTNHATKYSAGGDPSQIATVAHSSSGSYLPGYGPNAVKSVLATTVTNTPSLGKKGLCSKSQILTENLKAGARNGLYSKFAKKKVTEVKILQAHMNRLGFASGVEDGILGPITDGAIKRMQKFLGTIQDGLVGPLTRELINNSCGEKI